MTHEAVGISVSNNRVSVGSAMFTMLPSRVAMNMPIDTVSMALHLYFGSGLLSIGIGCDGGFNLILCCR